MRKLIVEEWISLDGYVSDKNGKLDFFTNTVREEYTASLQQEFLETVDCILFGRKTYEQFASIWPYRPVENDFLAAKINTGQKFVFSKTLPNAPWGNWQEVKVENGIVTSRVKELKSIKGKNIVLWGSISIAQSLMKENLVNELRLHLCPMLTAGSRKFFSEEINPATLVLSQVHSYSNGNVLLNYIFNKL